MGQPDGCGPSSHRQPQLSVFFYCKQQLRRQAKNSLEDYIEASVLMLVNNMFWNIVCVNHPRIIENYSYNMARIILSIRE